MSSGKRGVEVLEMTDSDLAEWRAAAAPLSERFLEEQEAAGRPARALAADMTRLAAEFERLSDAEILERVRSTPVQGIIDL